MKEEGFLFGLLLFICFLLNCILISEVFSAELKPQQAVSLYAVAYGQVGHLPQSPPTIHIVNRKRLCEIAEQKEGCRVRGVQLDDSIYLDETLDFDTPEDSSIALHEFVHYVQWAREGRAKSSDEWLNREVQAYSIQIEALARVQGDFSIPMRGLQMMRGIKCSP